MAEDLVNKVISFIAGEPGSDKTLIKQTVKDLTQNKFGKFFRIKSEEADPSLAYFLFTIYKITFPVRVFMQNEEKMAALRQKIVELFIDPAMRETIRRIGPESVRERASTHPAELTAQIHADLGKIASVFDNNRIYQINHFYNLAAILSQFVNYNFPSVLKKFDQNFLGGNFAVEPKFSPIKFDQILKNMGEFLSVAQPVNHDEDWKMLLDLLRVCAGKELVPLDAFVAMVSGLRDMLQAGILEMMGQYVLRTPVWECKPRIPDEHAAETWLEAKKSEAMNVIHKINYLYRTSQISVLVKQIFNTTNLVRLDNYTAENGAVFRKKDLEDYVYADGLNYLKAFIEDFVEKEIYELCDILLVRGQWSSNALSKDMSEALHRLLELPAPINELDESFSDEGKDGSRLRGAILRVDRDKTQIRYINSIIGNNNDEALELINAAAQDSIIIGKQLKSLVEDVQKKLPDLIINWKELNSVSRIPLAQRMTDDCKKLNYFVQLMKLCTQED